MGCSNSEQECFCFINRCRLVADLRSLSRDKIKRGPYLLWVGHPSHLSQDGVAYYYVFLKVLTSWSLFSSFLEVDMQVTATIRCKRQPEWNRVQNSQFWQNSRFGAQQFTNLLQLAHCLEKSSFSTKSKVFTILTDILIYECSDRVLDRFTIVLLTDNVNKTNRWL